MRVYCNWEVDMLFHAKTRAKLAKTRASRTKASLFSSLICKSLVGKMDPTQNLLG